MTRDPDPEAGRETGGKKEGRGRHLQGTVGTLCSCNSSSSQAHKVPFPSSLACDFVDQRAFSSLLLLSSLQAHNHTYRHTESEKAHLPPFFPRILLPTARDQGSQYSQHTLSHTVMHFRTTCQLPNVEFILWACFGSGLWRPGISDYGLVGGQMDIQFGEGDKTEPQRWEDIIIKCWQVMSWAASTIIFFLLSAHERTICSRSFLDSLCRLLTGCE